ncbi:hypothetical protein DMC30DRAFT_367814 [Rhodotorula diobovata]|uniref:C2H2-type domain-containing protein n=1 Tax=Rhodotorula diobovata TaxID=5288 RepID=A0A5C5FS78_9BASI|nr:hypothetical protein DMC30DRAFT_367814 [Rhodotorula diobovata]
MTAPSGPSYFHGLSYSAAPSAFYAPALQTSANAALTHDALNLAPAPPPLAPPGSSGGLPPSQLTFQYAVDTSPNLDYDAFRARGFSMPDMAASGAGSAGDPAGGEGASPSSSGTPFFYTPPSIAPGSTFRAPHQPVPPATAPEGYYPAVFDPSQAILPHPLAASTSALLPPAPELPPPPSLQQQRPQTGPTTTRRSSTGGGGSKQYNFVQQAGQTTKRPRRRYDEIERMYNCDYPGCTKAYGTLNHLNSHKTMQKHGPKSTPAQFKEMRKAWRERKKAEAAAAARSRAVQPQPPLAPPPAAAGPPGGGGGLPNVLAMPPHMNERPRPSTSAGEYHFSLPAPFMTPLGAPMLAYPAAPAPPMAAPQGMFEAPAGPPHQAYDGELGGGYDVYGGGGGAGGSGSAMRPVTAPSYYVAPQFGAGGAGGGLATHPLAQPPATAGSYVPQRLVSGQAGAGGDRRFSLPSSSLGYGAPQQQQQQQQQQQPATTLEMPRPVHAGPNGYSALIHGGVTAAQTASSNGVGSGADGRPGSGSLGLGAGAGGAAKLALGGAGGGDEGGSFEEIAAQ